MKMQTNLFASFFFAYVLLLPSVGWGARDAYYIDASTFLQLPKHCQGWFANAARAGNVKGLPVDLRKHEVDLKKLFGSAAIFMNHYCPALGDLIKFENYGSRTLSDEEKRRTLTRVLRQMNYQLNQTGGGWNKSNAWFHAEVIKNRAYTYRLMGDNQSAINDYSQSIKIYPPYLPAYWGLADIYEETGQPNDAVGVLQKAAGYARNKKFAQKINERIANIQASLNEPVETQ